MSISIGFHLIARGNEDNIVKCLESCRGLADFIVVAVDSREDSDKTFNLIKDMENVYAFRDVWEDSFATARNHALNKLLELKPDLDYIGWLDSDDRFGTVEQGSISHEEVRKRLETERPEGVNNQYVYAEDLGSDNPNLSYLRLRIVAHIPGQPLLYDWEGSAHETLICRRSTGRPTLIWNDWILVHYREKDIDFKTKTGRNVDMLEKDLEKNPTNTRTMFYLGREYKDFGDFDKSIVMLTKYVHKSNFNLEKYQALLDLGYMYFWKGDFDSAEDKTKDAIALLPEIAFAYNLLGEITMKKDRPDLARMYFAQAAYAPHGPVLFDYIPSRTYIPHRWLSVSCMYSNMKEESVYHHMKAKRLAPRDLGLKYNDPWLIDNLGDLPEELERFDGNFTFKDIFYDWFIRSSLPYFTKVIGDSSEFDVAKDDALNNHTVFVNQDLTEELLEEAYNLFPDKESSTIILKDFGDWKVKNIVARFLPKHENIQLVRNYELSKVNPSIDSKIGIGILIRT